MSIKDNFDKVSLKVSSEDLQNARNELISDELVDTITEDAERYLPKADFTIPYKFARYGSAEKYYEDSIKNIYQNYPYDGSTKEKQQWRNSVSQFDLFMFDEIYPKTTGYISLSASQVTYDNINNKYLYTSSSYIDLVGGPNPSTSAASISEAFKYANVFDISKNRSSNLALNYGNLGNTVEFWLKLSTPLTNYVNDFACIFDLWNHENVNTSDLAYLSIKMKEDATNYIFRVYIGNLGGSYTTSYKDFTFAKAKYNFLNWKHVAVSIKNETLSSTEKANIYFYIDGKLVDKNINQLNPISKNITNKNSVARIGNCFMHNFDVSYAGKQPLIASIDEFRFWKEMRTSQQIYRNWFTSIDGGSNSDDTTSNLGVYYKFNEGILGNGDIDSIILDYSGRVNNGKVINVSSSVRSVGSAIQDYSTEFKENPDPIIYSNHPSVKTLLSILKENGADWDSNNNANIYKTLPTWIIEEQEKKGTEDLANLVQIISSYFDNLHLQIENVNKLKHKEYITKFQKPYPFAEKLLTSNGFENLSIFNDSTLLENIASRGEGFILETSLNDIKNEIYQNIYNNLIYIYKSKGTEKSLRNLLRCFGIDDELVKINLYSNNNIFEIKDAYQYVSVPKKFIDFNRPDSNTAFVYQRKVDTDSSTRSYISGSKEGLLSYIPVTLQSEVIFPKKFDLGDPNYVYDAFTKVSLFGAHSAVDDENDYSWGDNEFAISVYANKRNEDSKDVYFSLEAGFKNSSLITYPVNLTSSWFNNAYNNEKWNLAVRIKPSKIDSGIVSGSDSTDYIVEFIGYNTTVDVLEESFVLSASVPGNFLKNALSTNKRVYAGAHYIDNNGMNLISKSNVKISSVRYWLDYLTNEEILAHSYDSSNSGRKNPYWNFSLLNINEISKINTLALNWDFNLVTGSDSNGEFFVEDASSGSFEDANTKQYGQYGKIINYRHTGYAENFVGNSLEVVNREYIFSAKQKHPESMLGSDLIQIRDTDDISQEKMAKPVSFYHSIEKSMYQVIDDEILNWFATIQAFNDLIGNPVEKYRSEYKNIQYLRTLFFEKVQNSPDFEKFLEFFKWIDSSINVMLTQLLPISADISDSVNNMIESHLLERNKYQNKLPILKKGEDPIATISSHLDYFYEEQKAPSPQGTGSLWLKDRANRKDLVVSSGNSYVDENREIVKEVLNSKNLNKLPDSYDLKTNTLYKHKKDYVRNFSNIIKLKTKILERPIDSISPINIQNNLFDSKFTLAGDSATGSAQIINKPRKQGNYFHTYEYVQLSDRSANNKGLPEILDKLDVTSSNFGFADRELPTRPVVKTIFVERFSAPGGPEVNSRGALDAESEQFSVYNSINNRNLIVRTNLNKWNAETSSISENAVSYHKVNKNPGYSVDNSGNSNPQYDNQFVVHQIPRSDLGYSWVTASLQSKPSASVYFGEYENLNSATSSIDFISSSAWIPGKLNLNFYNNIDLYRNYTLITYSQTNLTSSNSYNINYKGANWQLNIKNNNKIVDLLRKNNLVSIAHTPDPIVNTRSGIAFYPRKPIDVLNLKEPPVEINLPIQHKIKIKGSADVASLASTYDNNKNKFANKDLIKASKVTAKETVELHDKLMILDKSAAIVKPNIVSVKYATILIPRKENIGLKQIRIRPNYADYINNIKTVSDIRTFWKNSINDRIRSVEHYDIFNFATSSYETLMEKKYFSTYGDEINYNINSISQYDSYKDSIYSLDASSSYSFISSSNSARAENAKNYAEQLIKWDGKKIMPVKAGLRAPAGSIENVIDPKIYRMRMINDELFFGLTDNVRPDSSISFNKFGSLNLKKSSSIPFASYDWKNYSSGLIEAGFINCFASASNGIYVGGRFSKISNTVASSIARWNGVNWLSTTNQKGIAYQDTSTGNPDYNINSTVTPGEFLTPTDFNLGDRILNLYGSDTTNNGGETDWNIPIDFNFTVWNRSGTPGNYTPYQETFTEFSLYRNGFIGLGRGSTNNWSDFYPSYYTASYASNTYNFIFENVPKNIQANNMVLAPLWTRRIRPWKIISRRYYVRVHNKTTNAFIFDFHTTDWNFAYYYSSALNQNRYIYTETFQLEGWIVTGVRIVGNVKYRYFKWENCHLNSTTGPYQEQYTQVKSLGTTYPYYQPGFPYWMNGNAQYELKNPSNTYYQFYDGNPVSYALDYWQWWAWWYDVAASQTNITFEARIYSDGRVSYHYPSSYSVSNRTYTKDAFNMPVRQSPVLYTHNDNAMVGFRFAGTNANGLIPFRRGETFAVSDLNTFFSNTSDLQIRDDSNTNYKFNLDMTPGWYSSPSAVTVKPWLGKKAEFNWSFSSIFASLQNAELVEIFTHKFNNTEYVIALGGFNRAYSNGAYQIHQCMATYDVAADTYVTYDNSGSFYFHHSVNSYLSSSTARKIAIGGYFNKLTTKYSGGGGDFYSNPIIWDGNVTSPTISVCGTSPVNGTYGIRTPVSAAANNSAWVGSIVEHPNGFYALGSFVDAHDKTGAYGIAKYDWSGDNAGNWSKLGDGFNGSTILPSNANQAANTLIVNDGVSCSSGLYVVGNFTMMGGVVASGSARWDGVKWNKFIDFNYTPGQIVSSSEGIFISGEFDRVYIEKSENNLNYDLNVNGALKASSLLENHEYTRNNIFYKIKNIANYNLIDEDIKNIKNTKIFDEKQDLIINSNSRRAKIIEDSRLNLTYYFGSIPVSGTYINTVSSSDNQYGNVVYWDNINNKYSLPEIGGLSSSVNSAIILDVAYDFNKDGVAENCTMLLTAGKNRDRESSPNVSFSVIETGSLHDWMSFPYFTSSCEIRDIVSDPYNNLVYFCGDMREITLGSSSSPQVSVDSRGFFIFNPTNTAKTIGSLTIDPRNINSYDPKETISRQYFLPGTHINDDRSKEHPVVNTILPYSANEIFIGGIFNSASQGLISNNITVFNPNTTNVDLRFKDFGSGIDGVVNTMFLASTDKLVSSKNKTIYIGGDFNYANGSVHRSIVRVRSVSAGVWSWESVASGLNGAVRTITEDGDGYLYFGGDFTADGNGNVYNNIVKYKPEENFYAVGRDDRNGFNILPDDRVLNLIYSEASSSIKIIGTFQGTRSGQLLKDKKYENTFEGFLSNNISSSSGLQNKLLIPRPQLTFSNISPPLIRGNRDIWFRENKYNNEKRLKTVKYFRASSKGIMYIPEQYVYETDVISGKKPFFDSYEEYFDELKPMSHKYSLVPEYIISNFIEEYIVSKNGNFKTILKKDYLSLDGALTKFGYNSINNSLNTSNAINTNIVFDNIKNTENATFNLKVSGLKKFLPKRDFYPSERIVKLSNYFINSFMVLNEELFTLEDDSTVYKTALSNGTPINQQILTLMQSMFAPGILLNTIKSSIAVDFPVFITSSVAFGSSKKPDFYGSFVPTTSSFDGALLQKGPIRTWKYDSIANKAVDYNPFYIIKDVPNYRFAFESLIEYDNLLPDDLKKSDKNIYYLNPTYYSSDIIDTDESQDVAYPSYNMGSGSLKEFYFKNVNYKLAMHNFLAEVPSFFLRNGLTNIISAPESEFKNAISGSVYKMDIVLERDSRYKEFIMDPFYEAIKKNINYYKIGEFMPFSPDSLYGPPVFYSREWSDNYYFVNDWLNYDNPYVFYFKYIDSPAYAPYVPPYYYGKSIARLTFRPNDSRKYSLDDIHSQITVEYVNTARDTLFAQKSKLIDSELALDAGAASRANKDTYRLSVGANANKYKESPAYKAAMNLSSSINMFMKSEKKSFRFDAVNSTIMDVERSPFLVENSWVIQTKFETPCINFIDANYENNLGIIPLGLSGSYYEKSGFITHLYKGIWTTYGQPIKEGEGIKMYIQESPVTEPKQKSLAQLCGFNLDTKKTIGLLSEQKILSEGVVVIPFTNIKNHGKNMDKNFAETLPEIIGENYLYQASTRSTGPYYYKLDRKIISQVLGLSAPFNRESKISYDEIKNILYSSKVDDNNSIVKLMKSMIKYVIPPHLDWIKNKEINPFVMYISEFDTTLDGEDLSDIWQGLMPKPARTVEEEEFNITHKFAKNEFYHGKKIYNDTRFKIFKIKQKGKINYYDLTADSKDDSRFKFNFSNSNEASRPEYSYNWPYDYFSLVELVNVEAEIGLDEE